MSESIRLNLKEDHVAGGFEWEIAPNCCDELKQALDARFVFVSNITDYGANQFYIMPLDSDGSLFRRKGVEISHCPWCGEKIIARKKYGNQKAAATP